MGDGRQSDASMPHGAVAAAQYPLVEEVSLM